MFINWDIIILPMIYKALLFVSSTRRFLFYTEFLFSLRLSTYISNISNIYNPDKKMSLVSQTICDHMFSDPKLDHTFPQYK